MKHKIIKLGGSVITNKAIHKSLNTEVLDALLRVLNEYKSDSDEKLWLFHGAGSFAHISAQKWLESGDDHWFNEAGSEVLELNAEITKRLTTPVSSHSPHNFWSEAENHWYTQTKKPEMYLSHGDIYESPEKQIISADTLIASLSHTLKHEPQDILLLGDTDGVLGSNNELLSNISVQSLPTLTNAKTPDVTGGMAGKIKALAPCVSPKTRIQIASGLNPEILADWLAGKSIVSTTLQP